MSPSSRRLTGVVIAILLVAGTLAVSAWRLRAIHARGWAGVTFMPRPSTAKKTKPIPKMPFGWRLGGVIVVYPDSPAHGAGIREGDVIESINGICTCDPEGLQRLDDRLGRGDMVVYRVERDHVVREVRTRLSSHLQSPFFVTTLIVAPLVGLVFLIIGCVIFWRRPDDRRAVVFFAMTTVAAIYFISSPVAQMDAGNTRGITSQQSRAGVPQVAILGVTALLFAPLFLHLALIFPRPRPILDRYPHILRWVYGPPATLVLAAFALFAYSAATRWKVFGWVVAGAAMLATLAAIGRVLREWRRHGRDAVLREPLSAQLGVAGLLCISTVAI